jgi:hypothetical protein
MFPFAGASHQQLELCKTGFQFDKSEAAEPRGNPDAAWSETAVLARPLYLVGCA